MQSAMARFEAEFNPKVADALREYTKAGGFPSKLGITVDKVEPGSIVCSLKIRPEDHCSSVGVVHGGVIASLIDHTLSLAVYPLVEVGKWVATVEFKTNYLGWVKEGTLVATGTVETLRRKIAVARVAVTNGDETVALAQGTLYVRDRA